MQFVLEITIFDLEMIMRCALEKNIVEIHPCGNYVMFVTEFIIWKKNLPTYEVMLEPFKKDHSFSISL